MVRNKTMDQERQTNERAPELVIAESTVPVLRAGYANAAIPIAAVMSLLTALLARSAGASLAMQVLAGAVLGGLLLYRYARSVSRIRVADDAMHFICSLHEESVRLAELEYVRLGHIAGSMMASIETKKKGRRFSTTFHYIAPMTNWGDVAQAQDRLETLLKSRGVPLRTPRFIYRRITLGREAK